MTDDRGMPERPGAPGREPIFFLPGPVTAIAGALIAVHLAFTFALNPAGQAEFLLWFAFIPQRLSLPEAGWPGGLLPLIWTPFTHAFLHGDWMHLGINTLWFLIFGTPVARRYGAGPLVAAFLACAAAGAVAFLLASWGSQSFTYMVGASGAIAGLTGVAVRFMFQPILVAADPETGARRVLGRRLATLNELMTNPRSRNFVLIWVALNAVVGFVPALGGAEVPIAWQAHLGGFVAGLLMAPAMESWARRRMAGRAQ